MSERLFGTDGVRGIPGEGALAPSMVRRIAFAAASHLKARRVNHGGAAPEILLARDTRHSGPALARSLIEGFSEAGCATVDIGVIPTPSLAQLTPRWGAAAGVMISASHNPPEFNGIKFFDARGLKLGEDAELEIEKLALEFDPPRPAPGGPRPPTIHRTEDAERDYLDFLRSTFPPSLDLDGMKVVLDAANGAAYRLGPRLFKSLGASVTALGCSPSGHNINLGSGALDTESLRAAVVKAGADIGVALDGDADRCILVDEEGRACDGDVILSAAAAFFKSRGVLRNDKVVVTVMSNFGLLAFLKERGIEAVQVPVGDRSVTEAVVKEDLSLGGENSGHIIFSRCSLTGDGLLTALQALAVLRTEGRPLSHYRRALRLFPQILKNVPVERKVPLEELPHFQTRLAELSRSLKGRGRIFVRYSGTEPVLRILVEGPSRDELKPIVSSILSAYKKEAEHER